MEMEKKIITIFATLIANIYIKNDAFKYIIKTRFFSFGLLFSEIFNNITFFLKLKKIYFSPKYLFIETTNLCNLKCIMCPVSDNTMMTREKKKLAFSNFKKIIDSNKFVKIVYLTNWGEPLLNNHIVDMVQYLSDRKIKSVITTNGILFNQKNIVALLKAGVSIIRISMDGINETYEKIRNHSFEDLKKNIDLLLYLKNRGVYNTKIELNCTYMEENEKTILKVKEKYKNKVDFIHFQGVIMFARTEREQKENRKRTEREQKDVGNFIDLCFT